MEDEGNAFYSIQQIRKIGNIPLEVMGFSTNELNLITKLVGLSFVFGALAQALVNFLIPSQPFIMYWSFLLVPIAMLYMRQINKRYGEGLSFFFIALFYFKHKKNNSFSSVCEYKKL